MINITIVATGGSIPFFRLKSFSCSDGYNKEILLNVGGVIGCSNRTKRNCLDMAHLAYDIWNRFLVCNVIIYRIPSFAYAIAIPEIPDVGSALS